MPPGKTPVRRRSTLDVDFAMDKQPPPAPGGIFNVVMIGAGGINFGSVEGGPWNHSFRLEHKLGPRLRVVALIDPNPVQSRKVLDVKRNSFVESAYRDTQEFATLENYLEYAKANPFNPPHVAIIGAPPAFHGSIHPGKNTEILLSRTFPSIAMFVEKPISTSPVPDVWACSHYLKERKHIVSVGYMLRYLKCVQMMKEIIARENLTVMGVVGRYIAAYAKIDKMFWWDKDMACGPIVEQGTHFVDLCRYFGGEANMSTIRAHALEHFEGPGKLSALSVNESAIPPERRIPRMTVASWKFESGAVCNFTHGLVLHGSRYDTTLEVYCDGWSFRLVDPYNNPTLYVRSPKDVDDREVVYTFPDDDPYFGEFSTFIDAVESGSNDTSMILSSFEDAVKTYDLTWRIREASEASTRELYGQGDSSVTLAAGSAVPSSLENTTTPTAGPTTHAEKATASEGEGHGLMSTVKEGIEKLGLGNK